MKPIDQPRVIRKGRSIAKVEKEGPSFGIGTLATDMICRSRFHQELHLHESKATDSLDFALKWPMSQVVCGPCRGRWSEADDHEPQRSDTWSFILEFFHDSGKSEREIRDALHGLCALVRSRQPQTVEESDSLYIKLLRGIFPKVKKANQPSNGSLIGKINIDPYGVLNCDGRMAPNELQVKKRHSEETSGGNEPKRTRVGSIPYLPHELVAMVVSEMLVAEPRCALDLVVPDWNICLNIENHELDKSMKITRIVTYTRGTDFEVGTLSCKYGHDPEDHILTSMSNFDCNAVMVNVRFSSEYTRQFYRSHTHVFTLGTSDRPGEATETVSGWRDIFPLRGQHAMSILPFDDEPIDIVKRRALPDTVPIYQHLRHIAVHSPLELMQLNAEGLKKTGKIPSHFSSEAVDEALDLDRAAHLWLSWSQMPNLETVLLDLRIYSHDLNTERRCLSKFQIMKRAKEMGRHLQLKMLMLAGLQSYSFHTQYNGATGRDVELWNEIDGEPNWIKIFRPAIRGGGRIMLVDKLTDNARDWPAATLIATVP